MASKILGFMLAALSFYSLVTLFLHVYVIQTTKGNGSRHEGREPRRNRNLQSNANENTASALAIFKDGNERTQAIAGPNAAGDPSRPVGSYLGYLSSSMSSRRDVLDAERHRLGDRDSIWIDRHLAMYDDVLRKDGKEAGIKNKEESSELTEIWFRANRRTWYGPIKIGRDESCNIPCAWTKNGEGAEKATPDAVAVVMDGNYNNLPFLKKGRRRGGTTGRGGDCRNHLGKSLEESAECVVGSATVALGERTDPGHEAADPIRPSCVV